MDEGNSEKSHGDYKLNISKEDLVRIYVKQWVLEWCRKYHPKAFEEAEKFVNDAIESSDNLGKFNFTDE